MQLVVALALLPVIARQPTAGPPESVSARRGIVFVIGGVGGMDPLNLFAPLILPHAGVNHEFCNFAWTHGKGRIFRDLQDTPYLLARAAELAEAIRRVKAVDPDRTVYLLCHSAGAAISLAAAEELPPATVERIILLAPAVSRDYDLRAALRATRREIVSFNSCGDLVMLAFGTSVFGTTDRVHAPAAGFSGFRLPESCDEEGRCLYRRLVQFQWRPIDLLKLRGGLHNGPCMPVFLATAVAPWLLP
jgi:pimeloyl-ACP methyl ester carboxylesterase